MYIVTGANSGIGRAIARGLAEDGKSVVMACRNREKALAERDKIREETGNSCVEVRELDLASLRSVKDFTEQIRLSEEKVQALVNNAGVMCRDYTTTRDGLETMAQVNYVAPWLLTLLLLPCMDREKGADIVNTSSCTYRLGKVEGLLQDKGPEDYSLFRNYGSSKLAVLLFTLELAERLKGENIRSNAVDPGVVNTGMITMHRWFDPLTDLFFRPFIKTAEQGAKPALSLLQEGNKEVNGIFWNGKKEIRLSDARTEVSIRKKLWKETETFLCQRGFYL